MEENDLTIKMINTHAIEYIGMLKHIQIKPDLTKVILKIIDVAIGPCIVL